MPTINFTISRSSDCEMDLDIEEVTERISYLQDKNDKYSAKNAETYEKFLRDYWAIIRSNKEDFSLEDESYDQLFDMQEAEEFPPPFGGEGEKKVLDLIHKYYENWRLLWQQLIEEKIDANGVDEYEIYTGTTTDISILEVQRE